jgi:hypothetical protein
MSNEDIFIEREATLQSYFLARRTEVACKKSVERKMNKMPQEYFHPGTCEATELGKRYGENLTPQLWDDPGHQWNLAKDTNWGAWSCCGCVCEFPGLPVASTRSTSIIGRKVWHENKNFGYGKCMLGYSGPRKELALDNGRNAKKKTEGKVWAWVDQAKSLLLYG